MISPAVVDAAAHVLVDAAGVTRRLGAVAAELPLRRGADVVTGPTAPALRAVVVAILLDVPPGGGGVVVLVENHGGDGARAFARERVPLRAFLSGELVQSCAHKGKGGSVRSRVLS